jgi:hypothetical protein
MAGRSPKVRSAGSGRAAGRRMRGPADGRDSGQVVHVVVVRGADALGDDAAGARHVPEEITRHASLIRRMRSAASGPGLTSGW